MARRISVKLDLEAAKYLAEARAVDTTTVAVDDKMKALGRQVDATGRDMDELAAQTAAAKKELGDLGARANRTSADLKLLDTRISNTAIEVHRLGEEYARTSDEGIGKQLAAQTKMLASLKDQRSELIATTQKTVDFEHKTAQAAAALKALDAKILATKALVHDLGIEFASTGDKATGKDLSSQRSLLGELNRLRKDLTEVAPQLPSLQFDFGAVKGALIPALIGGAVAAAPAVGAAVSGAVLGAVGVGGIAGGVFAAAHDPRVQAAWAEFTSSLSAKDFGSEVFAEPTIEAIAVIKDALDRSHIGDILGKGAGAIVPLAVGLADFTTNILPGFSKAMDKSMDVANIFQVGLGDVGGAVGDMIGDFADSEGSMEGLRLLFVLTTDAIDGVSAAVTTLGDGFDWLAPRAADIGDEMARLYSWFPWVHDALQGFANDAHDVAGDGEHMASVLTSISYATQLTNQGLDPFVGYLKAATKATWEATEAGEAFAGQLTTIFNGELSVSSATIAWNQDILDLKESVKKHGHSLDDNTQAGLNNQKMIQGLVQDAMTLRDATLVQTGSIDDANAAYMNQIGILKELLDKMGFTKQQIDELVGTYDITIRTTYVSVGSMAAINRNLALENKLSGGRASGGPVGPGSWLVGEGGRPEVLTLGPGQYGHVTPSVGQWQASQSSSGGGGDRTFTIIVKDTSGRTLRTEAINEALGRGVTQTLIAAAYP